MDSLSLQGAGADHDGGKAAAGQAAPGVVTFGAAWASCVLRDAPAALLSMRYAISGTKKGPQPEERAQRASRRPQRADPTRPPCRRPRSLDPDGREVVPVVRRVDEALDVGRVDILVNNAGIPAPTTFQETDLDDWHQVVGVNLSGAFYLTKALWDVLVESGAGYVVIVSGTNGRRASSSPAYSSAKFGLTGLTRAIAASGSAQNLRATVLYPGAMDTGWRAAPIGVKPRTETMDPQQVAQFVGWLVTTPQEFVMNEAVLNPIGDVWV